MASTHSDIIKARAQKIGTLDADGVAKITNDILSQAASMMQDVLGIGDYGNYVRMFTDNSYTDTDEYHALADGQRKLRDLETAESYYVLYFLALALRKIYNETVVEEKIQFGEGNIDPAPIKQLVLMRDQYLRAGNQLTSKYTGSLKVGAV